MRASNSRVRNRQSLEEYVMQVTNVPLSKWRWFAPAFLLLILALFLSAPGTLIDKSNFVCFGI